MIERILKYSVERRHWVVALTLVAALFGAWSLSQLPIDAVPDITNKQVQINVEHPAFSTTDIERLVTFPLETALAGIPGLEHTRSISRNGFCQVTAVFDDAVDIYFARQQINERLTAARESLPSGIKPRMGPITTGLGEVLMWAVEFEPPPPGQVANGKAGWQASGDFVTPGGELSAHGAGLDHPAADQNRPARGRRRCHRRLCETISRAAPAWAVERARPDTQ